MSLFAPFVVCALALTLDRLLGEPSHWHPLVGFGRMVTAIERQFNTHPARPWQSILKGSAALLLVTLPILGVAVWLSMLLDGFWLLITQAIVLWLALSLRGLSEHGLAVAEPLHSGDLATAREQVSRIVSRQASALDERGVDKPTSQ